MINIRIFLVGEDMKKKMSSILLISFIFFNLFRYNGYSKIIEKDKIIENSNVKNNIKRDLLVLMLSYKEEIIDIEVSKEGYVYLIFNNGKKVLYDDKKVKSRDEKLSNADVQDTLEEIYPLESTNSILNIDPGRSRCYPFLNAIYGSSKGEIEKNIGNVSTLCGNITFNKNARAGESLKGALNGAKELAMKDNNINNFLFPISGGYNYRVIQDTGRLSPHAYAIAIDLKRDNADYWKWASKEKGSKRIEEYPSNLVRVFEDEGFVWGGKWEHFDILHFEYRPEIILKSKCFGDNSKLNEEKWYEGVQIDDEVESLIDLIDNKV